MTLVLSTGERAVLARLAQGFERKEIAADLKISVSAVNSRIYEAERRNKLKNANHLLAVFVGETVLAAARAEGSLAEGT
jgi:FixJ family two-component response regulator